MLEDTGEMVHWEPNKYIDMWTNARIDRYTKLTNQMCVEGSYENTGYSDRTSTSSYKYTGRGGSTGSYDGGASTTYLSNKMSYLCPHFEFTKSDYGVWKIKYEIQPGDTLSEIASAAGSPLELVLKYNPQIRNPNKIKAYDWIDLPTGLLVEPEKFAYEFNQCKELLKNKTVAEFRYATRKDLIDTHSRMTLKVDGKHTLCLSCGRFIRTPKIGKYNDRYCESCGCYMPEIMFGKE